MVGSDKDRATGRVTKALSRLVRGLLASALLAPVAVTSSSCVGLLELNDYGAATLQLCNQLATCFGTDFFPNCRQMAEPRLSQADEATREVWLQAFSDDRCLESCTNARICLDRAPICTELSSGCDNAALCCGFISGKASCEPEGEDDGVCCKPDGVACAGSEECCESDCDGGFCGGFQCLESGQACEDDFECCTKICEPDGTCSDAACAPLAAGCSKNAQCCSSFCNVFSPNDDGSPGTCEEADCGGPVGSLCLSSESCCTTECVFNAAGTGYCSQNGCLPQGAACDPDDPGESTCCGGSCDPTFRQCRTECKSPTEACEIDGECCSGSCSDSVCDCIPGDGSCLDHDECCSGICEPDGTCNACDHGVCETGPALDTSCECDICEGNANLPNAVEDCVGLICEMQPSCCEEEWSSSCVLAVSAICGAYCPPPPI